MTNNHKGASGAKGGTQMTASKETGLAITKKVDSTNNLNKPGSRISPRTSNKSPDLLTLWFLSWETLSKELLSHTVLELLILQKWRTLN